MMANLPGLDQDGLSSLTLALAHEIKNPAALALAHVAQLRKRTDLPGIGDTCDHVEEALEQICHLVQEMLLVTYGTAPAYEFDLEDILLDMLEAYQAAWPQISFSLDSASLMYYGEETFIKIIFSNLIKNAVEAVAPNGSVNIRLEKSDEHACICIQDSGNTGTTLKPHASGMGLVICKWLLGRMGGKLELVDIGSGCEARVVLPIMH